MNNEKFNVRFLLISNYIDLLVNFRGALIAELREKGYQIHVAVPYSIRDQYFYSQLVSYGVIVHNIPLERVGKNPFKDIWAIWRLYKIMKGIDPYYVLSYAIKPVIYGTLAASLHGVQRRYALISGLGFSFLGGKGRGIIRMIVSLLYSVALSKAEVVFFQNRDDEKLFRKNRIISPNTRSCVVRGSGVDIDKFKVVPLPSTICFLLIARLIGDKGVREYVQAAKRVRQQYPTVKFVLAGWIDHNPDAIQQSELDEWIESDYVDYRGRLEDVRETIASCSVYVLPSYREGTPRTVLEAMAMGRAVITTDAPGCRDTVVDGRNGYLVPIMSVDPLVAAMIRFIVDPQLAVEMGAESRRIATEIYDVRKVNAQMLKEMSIY